jgi:predicted GIY-YIG superfamily endonuclease
LVAREALLIRNIMWTVYIILNRGKYYTGITNNLIHRLRQHGDVEFLYKEEVPDKYQAAAREEAIKGLSRTKKQALMAKFSRRVYAERSEVSPTRGVLDLDSPQYVS